MKRIYGIPEEMMEMINEKYDRKQNNNLLQSLCHLCDILRGEDFLFYF